MERIWSVPLPIAAILEKSSKSLKFAQGVLEYRLRLAWTQVVGPTIAQQAQPARFSRGVLTVAVKSSVWIQELQLMVPEILPRLRRLPAGRSVNKIRLRIGKVEPPEKSFQEFPKRLSNVELETEALSQLDQLCASVADEELRSIIRRVAEKDARLRRLREKENRADPINQHKG